jgi:ribokinase
MGSLPFPSIVVVGTLNVDFVWMVSTLPRAGQTIIADATQREFGGKGANQAVAAARQDARVTLIGAVGDDAEGRLYREHLAREEIGDAHVLVTERFATGAAHVYVDPQGENLIVVDRGANQGLDTTAVRIAFEQVREKFDVLLTQLECPLEATVTALRLAAERGVRTLLNASPSNPRFPWGEVAIDSVIVNEHECADCFGYAPAELWALPEAGLKELLRVRGVRHIVVTQGAEPTLLVAENVRQAVPTHPVVPRDTVGAGDMFAGTLAAELAGGRDWEAALRHANVAAALSTLALGAQAAMPTRTSVEAITDRKTRRGV